MKKILFIDRDGTLINEPKDFQVDSFEKLSFKKSVLKYLSKISDAALYAYNVYQIEGEGRALFSKIDGDDDTIMGLHIKKIKEYLELQK